MNRLSALLCLVLGFLCSCTSSATKHAPAAEVITREGNATIENFKSGSNIGFGEVARSFRVHHIDGEFVAKGKINGVFKLTPGRHVLTIWVQFSHVTGALSTRSEDAAQIDIPIEAVSGQRYTIAGRERKRDSAEIWVTNIVTGEEVGEHRTAPVNTTVQDNPTPIFIPIPIH